MRAVAALVTLILFAIPLAAAAEDASISQMQSMINQQNTLIAQLQAQVKALEAQLAALLSRSGLSNLSTSLLQSVSLSTSSVSPVSGSSTMKVSDTLLNSLRALTAVSSTTSVVFTAFASTTPANNEIAVPVTSPAPHSANMCVASSTNFAEGSAIYGDACPGSACFGVTGPVLVCTGGQWYAQGESVCKSYPALSFQSNDSSSLNAAGKAYLRTLGCNL